jgi:hypothetical protein
LTSAITAAAQIGPGLLQNKEQGHIAHQNSEGAQQRCSAPQGGTGDNLLEANIRNNRFDAQKDAKGAATLSIVA